MKSDAAMNHDNMSKKSKHAKNKSKKKAAKDAKKAAATDTSMKSETKPAK